MQRVRSGEERLGEPRGQLGEPSSGENIRDAAGGRSRGVYRCDRTRHALQDDAQRRVEDQMGRRSREASARLLEGRLRRFRLGDDRRAELRRDARVRGADLHERPLPQQGRVAAVGQGLREDPRPRQRHAGLQSGFVLPPHVHRARGLGGPQDRPAFRRRWRRVLRLGQRQEGRLRRGLEAPVRVRHHPLLERKSIKQSNNQTIKQPPLRPGLPLVRRQLPRGPGHVPLLGHLPRRHALVDAEGRHLGLPREDLAQGRRREVPVGGAFGRGHRRRVVRDAIRRGEEVRRAAVEQIK